MKNQADHQMFIFSIISPAVCIGLALLLSDVNRNFFAWDGAGNFQSLWDHYHLKP